MLKSFFWMCSGADPDLLAESPKSEQIKYAGVGGTVFFTAIMAFIASAYALYTVFDNIFASLFFGVIWGLLIFNLDRFIVSTIKKCDNFMDELLQASPRILLAVIIAVVIAKPLELKIFEKEIDQVLLEEKNSMTLANQEQIGSLYADEFNYITNEVNKIETDISNKENEVNSLYDTYIAEAEGREGTLLLGKGPVYKEKREKHDTMLAELVEMKNSGNARKATLLAQRANTEQKQAEHLTNTQPIINGFDGLMARVAALEKLPWLPSFFIFLLFLAIETSPVFAKLLTPKGIYDIRFNDLEESISVWADQKKSQRLALLVADTELNNKVYTSVKKEEETYHYKKQQARALLRFQSDAFFGGAKELIEDLRFGSTFLIKNTFLLLPL